MKKIGFILHDLTPAQLSYGVIKECNYAVAEDPLVDPAIFYEEISLSCAPVGFATYPVIDMYHYDGPLFATSLSGVAKLFQCLGTAKKYFYVHDLEWLRINPKSFEELCPYYRTFPLIVRSTEHKRVVEDAWNVKVAAVEPHLRVKPLLDILSSYTPKD